MEGVQRPPEHPPAGWYKDPENPDSGRPRWWDGTRWTDTYQPEPPAPTQAQWILAVLLLAIPAVLNGVYDANHGETTSYGIGSAFGSTVWSGLLALLFRWLYVRFSERQRRVWSPWVFVIAAAIATLGLLGAIAADARDEGATLSAVEEASAECDERGYEKFPPLGGGLAYRDLTSAEYRRTRIPPQFGDAFEIQAVTKRSGRPIALVTATGIGPDPREAADARAGFADGAGTEVRSIRLEGGTEIRYARPIPGEITALVVGDCYARGVNAVDLRTIRFISTKLAGE